MPPDNWSSPSFVLLNIVLLSLFRICGMSQHSQLFELRERSRWNVDSPADQPQWLHPHITNHWGLWLHLLTFWHRCCTEWKHSTLLALSYSGTRPPPLIFSCWLRTLLRAAEHCHKTRLLPLGKRVSIWRQRKQMTAMRFSNLQWGLSLSWDIIHLRFSSSGGL